MNATITSTAHYVPEKVLTNSDLEKLVDTSDEWIKSRVGINQRHVVADGEASSDMSTKVAHSLLEKRGISAANIDVIIIGTVTLTTLPPLPQLLFKTILMRKMHGHLI